MSHAAFSIHRLDGELVLTVDGEVDLVNAASLRAAILSTADGLQGRRMVIDVSQLAFIDSSGLHALVSGARALPAKFVLRNPQARIQRVLELALPGFFEMEFGDLHPHGSGLPNGSRLR